MAIREYIAKTYFDPKDYTSLDGSCGSNCFDGVFINKKTGQLVIVEVKPLTNAGVKLSPANGSLPAQMTDDWIAHAAGRLKDGDDVAKATYAKLLEFYDADTKRFNAQKAVIGVNSKDVKLIMLK